MSFFLLAISLFFLILGLVFIYKPTWIVRFNKFVRERVFNDTLILLDRRKKGFFFFLMFFIFFYWGYDSFQYHPAIVSNKLISTQRLLYLSEHHLHLKEYQESRKLCEIVLEREPNNALALYQLAASQFLLNEPDPAQQSWAKAKGIDPEAPMADRLRKLVVRQKKLPSEDIPALK